MCDDCLQLLCVLSLSVLCILEVIISHVSPPGPVVLSTPAQLVAPVVVARGTLSITTTEIYFEVDEEDPTFKSTDAKVRATCFFIGSFSSRKSASLLMYCFSLIQMI